MESDFRLKSNFSHAKFKEINRSIQADNVYLDINIDIILIFSKEDQCIKNDTVQKAIMSLK